MCFVRRLCTVNGDNHSPLCVQDCILANVFSLAVCSTHYLLTLTCFVIALCTGLTNVQQLAAAPISGGDNIDKDMWDVLRKAVSTVQLWEWLNENQLTVVYSSLIDLNVKCLDEIVNIQRCDTLQAKLQSWHGSQVLHELLTAAKDLEHKRSSVAGNLADEEQGSGTSDVSSDGGSK